MNVEGKSMKYGVPALEVRSLNKSFGKLPILKNIELRMQEGELLVLVGPSGSGKSTLLSCIAGLTEIDSGVIRIGGVDVTRVRPAKRNIAMVFQSYALFPTMSAAENMRFGMRVRKVPEADQRSRVDAVSKLLKIEHLLERRPWQLSGGQRQRVAMGRALVREPKLFLFDEPLSNLDAKLRISMRTEIKRLHQDLNASIVYVTHDQVEAMTLATGIVVLKEGVVQQFGTPEQIYNLPANTFVADFMGAPSMNLIPSKATRQGSCTRIEIEQEDGPTLELTVDNIAGVNSFEPQNVIVGIRPEKIMEMKDAARVPAVRIEPRIEVVEPAGADTYVVFRLGGREVTARLEGGSRVAPGTRLPLLLDLRSASYFDEATGNRLESL
jgi:multiple sugar transport system ATP-binding protein